MLDSGEGVQKNESEAYKWFLLAEANGLKMPPKYNRISSESSFGV